MITTGRDRRTLKFLAIRLLLVLSLVSGPALAVADGISEIAALVQKVSVRLPCDHMQVHSVSSQAQNSTVPHSNAPKCPCCDKNNCIEGTACTHCMGVGHAPALLQMAAAIEDIHPQQILISHDRFSPEFDSSPLFHPPRVFSAA